MQDIFNINIGDVVFQNWIVTKRIGSGASGIVYEVKKTDGFIENTSVLKVIYIPQDEYVKRQLAMEGMQPEEVTSYIRNIVDTLVEEIKIMVSFKEFPYIVRCEDHDLYRSDDESKWCILIRMEKLISLPEYQINHDLTEQNILKLAVNMTKTLGLFAQNGGIIHRDIKPQNIFVSPYGDYKLGDFGIARICDATVTTLSRKGTEEYMAPEVYWNERYDASVDIYSLGLVLYQALNHNRLPFLPLTGSYTAMDRHQAFIKRIRGKSELPSPVDASPSFARIILKMCAYDPDDRYKTAPELLDDLLKVVPSETILRHDDHLHERGKTASNDFSPTVALFTARNKHTTTENLGSKPQNSINNYDIKSEQGNSSDNIRHYNTVHNKSVPEYGVPIKQDQISDEPVLENSDTKQKKTLQDTIPNALQNEAKAVQQDKRENVRTIDRPAKKRNWKKVSIYIVNIVIIAAAIMVPFFKNRFGNTYTLTVKGASGSGLYHKGKKIELHAGEDSAFTQWTVDSGSLEISDDELLQKDLVFSMPAEDITISMHGRSVEELYALGKDFYSHEQYGSSLDYFCQAAALGSANGAFYAGSIYHRGLNGRKDFTLAHKYYNKAVENGSDKAAEMLGIMYLYGLGVTCNVEKALEYFLKAADLGDTKMLYCVGYMYDMGNFVPQNQEKANEYYAAARRKESSQTEKVYRELPMETEGVTEQAEWDPADNASEFAGYYKSLEESLLSMLNSVSSMNDEDLDAIVNGGGPLQASIAKNWIEAREQLGQFSECREQKTAEFGEFIVVTADCVYVSDSSEERLAEVIAIYNLKEGGEIYPPVWIISDN